MVSVAWSGVAGYRGMSVEMRTINLSSELCRRAEQRFAAHFNNIEELLQYVLGFILSSETAQADQSERSMIEQRLKDLGYL